MALVRNSLGMRLLFVGALAAAIGGGAALRYTQTSAQEQGVKQTERHNEAHHYAKELSLAFREAAQATIPTVVTITSVSKAHAITEKSSEVPGHGENPFKGTPFEDFFKDFQGNAPGGAFRRFVPKHGGMGSGVIIDKSGIILTNNHVVDGADQVMVKLSDGREFEAKNIKTDKETDLAVIHIEGAGTLPAAPLGDSDALEVGEWVIAVGNPFNQESTVSAGIVSGKGRSLGETRTAYIQTDAAINPGNSGGPLMNLDGEVVGINTAIATNSGSYQGVGFAIPVNEAKWVVKQLLDKGVVKRAYLGVGLQEVSGELAAQFGVTRRDGLLVGEVMPSSPAAEAGFQPGDIITEYAGAHVNKMRDLQAKVEQTAPGTKEEVKILRAGKPITLTVVVKPLPENAFARQPGAGESEKGSSSESTSSNKDFGLEVADMSSAAAEQFGYTGHKGVLITGVDPAGIAADRGLTEGMLILKVKVGKNFKDVTSVGEFEKAMAGQSPEKGVVLYVHSSGGSRLVVLKK
jgi:serine protease Do